MYMPVQHLPTFILLGMASRTCCSASNMIGEASGLELLGIGSWLLSGACWWVGVSSAPGPVYLHVCRVKGTDLCPFTWQLNLSPLTIWEARRGVWLNRHGEGPGIGKWTWAESRVRSLNYTTPAYSLLLSLYAGCCVMKSWFKIFRSALPFASKKKKNAVLL